MTYHDLKTNSRRFLFETKVGMVEKDNTVEVDMLLFNDLLLLVQQSDNNGPIQYRYVLDKAARVKMAPDAKYFKNLVCVTTATKTLTFSCKTSSKR